MPAGLSFVSIHSYIVTLYETLARTPMTVGELAEVISETPVSVIKFLMTDLGVMAAISQTLDVPTCEAVVEGFGKVIAGEDDEDEDDDDE